jgi:hypothetical protein
MHKPASKFPAANNQCRSDIGIGPFPRALTKLARKHPSAKVITLKRI